VIPEADEEVVGPLSQEICVIAAHFSWFLMTPSGPPEIVEKVAD
jgi:hypothetical protein